MTSFEYKGHSVMIQKQRGTQMYNVTILELNNRKIVKTMKDISLPLGRVKTRAKDWIGL